MLFNKLSELQRNDYILNLQLVASLSALFSNESAAPYLVSRATENVYCDSIGARNLGRDDTAIDALYDNYGVGIKTFLHNNGKTLQKVAEFNKESSYYRELSPKDKILYISKLRNGRLKFAMNNYGVDQLIYHCITRKTDGTINIYEIPMDFINISKIHNIVVKQNSITFHDGLNEYNFNLTKSTLLKRFDFSSDSSLVSCFNVTVLQNPFDFLKNAISIKSSSIENHEYNVLNVQEKPFVVLPLYSYSNSVGKFVAEKSGLNQWNAGGRKRNPNEVYIPISRKIHNSFPNFFPGRDQKFKLNLPNGECLSVKVCQQGNKALMSDPNKALGEWLLRDVLELNEGHLLTYEKLIEIGVDSVIITKNSDLDYSIDFCSSGSFDDFAAEYNVD